MLSQQTWRRPRIVEEPTDSLFGEADASTQQKNNTAAPRPDLTAMLYDSKPQLTSGPGLFGTDAISGADDAPAKPAGSLFDDEDENDLVAQISKPAEQ